MMQEAFKEAGIEFAHRNVTVYMQPEGQQSVANADAEDREKMVTGAAAAAMAAEEQKPQETDKGAA